ncbi:hypothetical protein VNO78_32625 [Psophocarpus tetragonolobus]|uniref:Uncharacterized protein n=1 Tax=Psophocarpus tetragonolobus TaxID=3891 RepID=A0AAN9NVM2_PSOTE
MTTMAIRSLMNTTGPTTLDTGLNGGRFGIKCSNQQLAAPINCYHVMAETNYLLSKYFLRELSSPKQRVVCSMICCCGHPLHQFIRIYNTLCSNHFLLFIPQTIQFQIYATRLFLHETSSLLNPLFSQNSQSYYSHFTTHTFLSLLFFLFNITSSYTHIPSLNRFTFEFACYLLPFFLFC